MTKIIELLEVIPVEDSEVHLFYDKQEHSIGDLLIAQNALVEEWFTVAAVVNPLWAKNKYPTYVLVKTQKPT